MKLLSRNIKLLTLLLLVVQLCLPVSGAVYVTEYLSSSEARQSGLICAHADAAADHEAPAGHGKISHCHELDAPCDTPARTLVRFSPLVSPLTTAYKGALLPGYGAPPELPPKNHV